MKKVIVVDLDGTLCDSSHREHHARNGDWEEFHAQLTEDKPHEDVLELIKTFSDRGYAIVGCTGRPERHRNATNAWMIKHSVPIDFVLMRGNWDFESDAITKPRNLLEWHNHTAEAKSVDLKDRVLFVLEDRDKVVESWRALGLNCWQVRAGGY